MGREADYTAGTLAPDSAEEATTLIPSLVSKIDPETLQPILEELAKMRMYTRCASLRFSLMYDRGPPTLRDSAKTWIHRPFFTSVFKEASTRRTRYQIPMAQGLSYNPSDATVSMIQDEENKPDRQGQTRAAVKATAEPYDIIQIVRIQGKLHASRQTLLHQNAQITRHPITNMLVKHVFPSISTTQFPRLQIINTSLSHNFEIFVWHNPLSTASRSVTSL